MMLYELDEIEKAALLDTTKPRPGERIQVWWCDECQEWHRGSVLGGPIGGEHDGERKGN